MQHPPTDKIRKQISNDGRGSDSKALSLIERYSANKQAFFERVQKKVGSDWFAPFPVVNPHKIIEESKTSPMSAAFMCQYACAIIAKMEERNVREYVAAAYFIACDMKLDERAIANLASDVKDGRYKNGIPIEVVREGILHYLFIYIFYQSGIRTRDRATQYAQGLKEYFYEGRPPNVVGDIILKHGPDRLRRVAQRKAQLIEGAQELAKLGKNPAAPAFDEVLATLVAEETKAATSDETDETFDHGSRDLPPNLPDEEPDANWITQAKFEEVKDDRPGELPAIGHDTDASHDDEPEAKDEQPVEPTQAGEQQAADENTGGGEDVGAEDKENDTDEAGFIDGEVIDKRLEQILLGTMSLGASLMTQPLDPDVRKHVVQTTVLLSNDLLDLRRMIKGV